LDNWRRVSLDNWRRVGLDNWRRVSLDKWRAISSSDKLGTKTNLVNSDSTMSENAGVSKGRWEDGDNSALLPSGTGKSLSVSNSVGVTGLDDFDSVLNWSWGKNLVSKWSDWANWKSVAGNTESSLIGNIFNSHFLSLGVDVGVASTDIASSITDSSVGLSRVGITVAGLAELILSVVLGLGGNWSNDSLRNILVGDWGTVGDGRSSQKSEVVDEELWVGAGASHNGGENNESVHVEDFEIF